MGTSSFIVIKTKKRSIYLWQQLDGYLGCVGHDLCTELNRMLDLYTVKDLREMTCSINEGTERFTTNMLESVFTNLIQVEFFNPEKDYDYMYIIDLENKMVIAKFENNVLKLDFQLIMLGYTFNDIYESINQ